MYLQNQGLATGVTDSLDLANLYGWFFERQSNILDDPRIPFYGHYINDCCAIVYANSEGEAMAAVNKITFNDCIIEWNVSDQFQVFLDMTLYVNEN
jgi:hypothetical protein